MKIELSGMMLLMIIIGITGTAGSGKGTVVEYLKDKYGFKHFSGPDIITKEVVRRDMPVNRDSKHMVGNDLRSKFGPGYIAEEMYKMAVASGSNSVVESIRAIGEVTTLRSKPESFYLLAVDADPEIRYQRVTTLRKGDKDAISYEKFLEQEAKEMNDTNPAGMNIAGCMKLADAYINNDGDMETLHKKIDELLEPLLHQ